MAATTDRSALDLELDQLSVHGLCEPAEVQPGEPISVQVEKPDMGRTGDLRVWRISPFGLELAGEGLAQE